MHKSINILMKSCLNKLSTKQSVYLVYHFCKEENACYKSWRGTHIRMVLVIAGCEDKSRVTFFLYAFLYFLRLLSCLHI